MTTRWFTDGKGQVPRYIWTRQVPLGYSDDGQGSHLLNPHFPGEKFGEHHISVGSRQTWKPPISMRLFVIIAVVIIFWDGIESIPKSVPQGAFVAPLASSEPLNCAAKRHALSACRSRRRGGMVGMGWG